MSKRISDQNKFNFFVPLTFEKGTDGDGKYLMKIKGVASTMDEDTDGEQLDATGFDFAPLLKSGMINWNHKASQTSAAICGKPTAAKIIKNPKGPGKAFEVEGVIFNNTEGKAVAELIEILENEPDRQLGWSIEGYKTNTDVFNSKKITGAVINGIALTHVPKNKNTFVSIIKGEYAEPFVDEEDEDEIKEEKEEAAKEEKAVTTETIAAATPESVEHDPKDLSNKNNNKEFGKLLKKSEIYTLISNNYPTAPIAEIKNIYNLALETSKKIFSMVTVTTESLQKAFDLLNEATALVKAEGATSEDKELKPTTDLKKGDDDVSEDDMEKAVPVASFLYKSGISDKEKMCGEMVKGGIALAVAQGAAEKVIAEMNATKDGGSISQGSITKAQIDELSIKFEGEIKKSLETSTSQVNSVRDAITKGFEGLGTIIKSLQETNETLVAANAQLTERLEKVENIPGVRKSITVAKAVEKFEKGQETNKIEGMEYININDKKDLRKLVNIIDAANDVIIKSQGKGDDLLMKSIESIEMANLVPEYAYARLRAMNIILQK